MGEKGNRTSLCLADFLFPLPVKRCAEAASLRGSCCGVSGAPGEQLPAPVTFTCGSSRQQRPGAAASHSSCHLSSLRPRWLWCLLMEKWQQLLPQHRLESRSIQLFLVSPSRHYFSFLLSSSQPDQVSLRSIILSHKIGSLSGRRNHPQHQSGECWTKGFTEHPGVLTAMWPWRLTWWQRGGLKTYEWVWPPLRCPRWLTSRQAGQKLSAWPPRWGPQRSSLKA